MIDRYKAPAHVAMFVSSVIWGAMSPITKVILDTEVISGYSLTTIRVIGATAAFWLASLFAPKERVPLRDLGLLFLASFLSIILTQGCFVVGLSYTTPIDATVIATTGPIITMLLAAIVLREPLTSKKALGVFIGLSGALMLILTGTHDNGMVATNSALGGMLCFIAQCAFSCYLVFFKNFINRYSPLTLMKWMFTFGSLILLPLDIKELVAIPYTSLTPEVYASIFYVVFIATFFAYLMIPIGQKRLRPTTFSVYNYIQPVAAAILAIYWGMDSFTPIKGFAVVLVFIGVYVVTQSKSRAQVEAEERSQL